MSGKRALVVDDSKSARVSMKRMLEKYDLGVDFAKSGEEALHFLEHSSTDVIFMDHTMPGMDGLEAVAAIKSNPRTATIPVMMYTTKEGDLYVSQARALGALAVLPKAVQPGVLYEMLLKLGLINERRDVSEEKPSEAIHVIERQTFDTSMQTLVTRTLEEQHLQLRADMLNSNRDFARRVSKEILEQQKTEENINHAIDDYENAPTPWAPSNKHILFWAAATFLPLFAAIWLTLNALEGRQQVQEELQRLSTLVENTQLRTQELNPALPTKASETNPTQASLTQNLVDIAPALEWALNENSQYPFQELAFNQNRTQLVQNLLMQLNQLNFSGDVQMEAHLGQFCLIASNNGGYQIAPEELPLDACEFLGHPLENTLFTSEHQSVEFVNFLSASPLLRQGNIRLSVTAHNRENSTDRYSMPADAQTAGAWNRVASKNNRIVYTLVADAE